MKPVSIFVLIVAFLLSFRYSASQAQIHSTAGANPERGMTMTDVSYAGIDSAIKDATGLRQSFPDSAIALLRKLYPVCDLLSYNNGKLNILLSISGILIKEKSNSRAALVYLRKAYPYCLHVKKNRDTRLVFWYSDMGGAFTHVGMIDSAMLYYYRGLSIALRNKWTDRLEFVRLYHNIAALHYNIGQYDKALLYTQKALDMALRLNAPTDIAENYANMASYMTLKKRYAEAQEYMKKIEQLNIPPDAPLKEFLNDTYGNMYLQQENVPRAIYYYQKALTPENRNTRYYTSGLIGMGCAYAIAKDFRTSGEYFKEALATFMRSNLEGKDISIKLNIYSNLAEVADSLDNYKEAYYYKCLTAALQDSLNNAQRFRNINELETRYRTSEKDRDLTQKQLQLVQAKNSLNAKNIWIGGTTAGVLILSLFIIQLLQRTRVREQKQKLDHMKVLITGEENERKRIGQQLHDDVMVEFSIVRMNMGTLPVQYPGIGEIKEYNDILHQLNQASFKLRQTAHNLMPDALLEEGLVSAIGYFCRGIQQMTPLVIDFQHYGDMPRLTPSTEIAIYRIVQELIQNVIKHAAATDVLVQLNYRKGHLSLTVEDNGVGMDPAGVRETNGIGLNSIRTRLKAINGQMEIHACTPQGTAVNMEINL